MTATAQRMLATASKQFAEKGYSGVSMRNIAAATGTTQAAIYHHFPNKQALYDAVLAQHFEATITVVVHGLADIADPEQRLRELIRRIVVMADEDAEFRQLYLRELLEGNSERLATLADNIYAGLKDTITDLARDLDAEVETHLFLFSIIGLICHHLEARELAMLVPGNSPANRELSTLSEHIATLLLYGVKGL